MLFLLDIESGKHVLKNGLGVKEQKTVAMQETNQ
jgi:hypothetical protein